MASSGYTSTFRCEILTIESKSSPVTLVLPGHRILPNSFEIYKSLTYPSGSEHPGVIVYLDMYNSFGFYLVQFSFSLAAAFPLLDFLNRGVQLLEPA